MLFFNLLSRKSLLTREMTKGVNMAPILADADAKPSPPALITVGKYSQLCVKSTKNIMKTAVRPIRTKPVLVHIVTGSAEIKIHSVINGCDAEFKSKLSNIILVLFQLQEFK